MYRGSPLSIKHFEQLKNLSNCQIPYLMVLGRKDLILYNLLKCPKVAELVGILLGQSSIYVKKGQSIHYSLVIYFNKRYHKDERYINYIKGILFKLFNITDRNGIVVNYNEYDEVSNLTINNTVIVYEILKLGVFI
ncbi:MAG: hypothetical protein ACFFDF_18485, partial [Candidatus Odinarchaeota archaeon]